MQLPAARVRIHVHRDLADAEAVPHQPEHHIGVREVVGVVVPAHEPEGAAVEAQVAGSRIGDRLPDQEAQQEAEEGDAGAAARRAPVEGARRRERGRVRRRQEPGADHHLAVAEAFEEERQEPRVVLAVAVQLEEAVVAPGERVLVAGLQGRAVAQVLREAEGGDAGAREDRRRVVRRGVVQGEQVVALPADDLLQRREQASEARRFVPHREDDEHGGAAGVSRVRHVRSFGPFLSPVPRCRPRPGARAARGGPARRSGEAYRRPLAAERRARPVPGHRDSPGTISAAQDSPAPAVHWPVRIRRRG